MGGVVSHNKDYLVISHSLRQTGGEEPGQEVLSGGGTVYLAHLGREGAGAVPGQHQGGGQQQQQGEHGNTLYLCTRHTLTLPLLCPSYLCSSGSCL